MFFKAIENIALASLGVHEGGPALATQIKHYRASMDPEQWVEKFRSALKSHDLVEYAVINHKEDMAMRGVRNPPWAYTLIFGNPPVGATYLAVAITAVADMPVRLGVYGDETQTTVVYRTMMSLLGEHDECLRDAGNHVDEMVENLCQESAAYFVVR
jgi:uncharacterized protein (DUF302 family)